MDRMPRPRALLVSLLVVCGLGLLLATTLAWGPPLRASDPTPATGLPTTGEGPIQATVLRVGDGDSIQVRIGGDKRTVRLACIDAPELDQPPWGAASRDYLKQRLRPGTPVQLWPKAIDRYGRLVAEVIGELNLNLVLVEDGQAFVYPKHVHQCDAAEYRQAEYRASRHRYGVWQPAGGIQRPWEHRQQQRLQPSHRPRPALAPKPSWRSDWPAPAPSGAGNPAPERQSGTPQLDTPHTPTPAATLRFQGPRPPKPAAPAGSKPASTPSNPATLAGPTPPRSTPSQPPP